MNAEASLKREFLKLKTKYSNLAGSLITVFQDELTKSNIKFDKVTYRIKEWESFIAKVRRKKYREPLKQINDICGFRIVIFKSDDLPKVLTIINQEFIVENIDDKNNELTPERFGYRSHHSIISVKDEWMRVPMYRDCKGLKFEVQIRTQLMDAWANISHQIFYKKGPIKASLQRRLYRLSALMEIGDSEIAQLMAKQPKNRNLDPELKKLQDTLDYYLPNRAKVPENALADLFKEMKLYKFTLSTLKYTLKTKIGKLLQIEKEIFAPVKNLSEVETEWLQVGVVRNIMYLTIDDYWFTEGTKYSPHFVSVIESHRTTFQKESK